jgi:glutathione S-transferase
MQNLKQARKEIKDHLAELQKELKALKEPFLTSDSVSQADVIPVMLPGRAKPCYLHCSKPESAPPKQLRLAQVARVIKKHFGPLKDLLSNSRPEGLGEWTGLLMREMSKTRPRAANLRVLQIENPSA